jgi:mRNA interferase MazF
MKLLRRGDIYLVNFRPDGREGEAAQIHPAILVSNNRVNAQAVIVQVMPLSSNLERIFRTDVILPNQRTGLDFNSRAQVEMTRAVHTSRLIKQLGFVPDDLMQIIDDRIRDHFDV